MDMGGVFKYEKGIINVTPVVNRCKLRRTVIQPTRLVVAQKSIGVTRAESGSHRYAVNLGIKGIVKGKYRVVGRDVK